MKLITVRKEDGLICSLCLEPIKAGEEAIQFYNVKHNKKNLREAHLFFSGGGFQLHYRHPLCQYNQVKRKVSFEEWISRIRFEVAQQGHHKNIIILMNKRK